LAIRIVTDKRTPIPDRLQTRRREHQGRSSRDVPRPARPNQCGADRAAPV